MPSHLYEGASGLKWTKVKEIDFVIFVFPFFKTFIAVILIFLAKASLKTVAVSVGTQLIYQVFP